MEQIKSALKSLQESIIRLESAVYAAKKNNIQNESQIVELKNVVKTAYDRLDKALTTLKQGGE